MACWLSRLSPVAPLVEATETEVPVVALELLTSALVELSGVTPVPVESEIEVWPPTLVLVAAVLADVEAPVAVALVVPVVGMPMVAPPLCWSELCSRAIFFCSRSRLAWETRSRICLDIANTSSSFANPVLA